MEEAASLHHKLISGTLPKLRTGDLWSPRILEAFQAEVIQRAIPERGALRLPEIGCGSGVYFRYAATRNPSLTALGLELQPAVAEMARRNRRNWDLEGRIKVEDGDSRAIAPGELFDIATPYNN